MSVTTADIQTPYGLLSLDREHDKKMVEALERGHYPNADLLLLVQQFLTPGSTAIDIGAHVGTFSVALAQKARVISFEPAPETFILLQKNTKRAQGEFDLRNLGLASKPGSARVVSRSDANAGAQTLTPGGDIVVSTLDAEVAHADFIKIDVEGMEEEVLLGGTELLEKSHPTIVFEVNLSQLRSHGSSPRALEKLLTERGYNLYFPLFVPGHAVKLSKIWRLGALTALIAPRAWLLQSDSAPFDVLAVAPERPMPVASVGFGAAVVWAVRQNIENKVQRIRARVSRYLYGD